jgi:DNA-binding GntR family transcriptional regulator
MSDMSFKQAKELVERMEFSEIAIRKAVDNLEKASSKF